MCHDRTENSQVAVLVTNYGPRWIAPYSFHCPQSTWLRQSSRSTGGSLCRPVSTVRCRTRVDSFYSRVKFKSKWIGEDWQDRDAVPPAERK